MAIDAYNLVKSYSQQSRADIKFEKGRKLDLFPPAGSMEPVAIKILRPLAATKTKNQFLLMFIK